MDVLETILRFMLRPAQRVNNPRAIRSSFVAPQDKILELARGWSIPYQDLESLCSDQFTPDNEMLTIKLQFYRTRTNPPTDTDNTNKDNASGIIPTVTTTTPPPPSDASNNKQDEGVHIVTENISQKDKKSDMEWFTSLVKQHDIPKEYHFELLNRIRIANNIGVPSRRKQLVVSQLIALSIMGKEKKMERGLSFVCVSIITLHYITNHSFTTFFFIAHTASESTAQNKVFVYEPHLVSHLADAVNPSKPISYVSQQNPGKTCIYIYIYYFYSCYFTFNM